MESALSLSKGRTLVLSVILLSNKAVFFCSNFGWIINKFEQEFDLIVKQAPFIIYMLSLLSCNDKLYIDEIDKNKFCQYFNIKTATSIVDGKTYKTASSEINKFSNDKVSDFIQDHSSRFDYIINKTFSLVIKGDVTFDSISLNNRFYKALLTDTFYNYFSLLTSGDRTQVSNKKESFTVPEAMKIASRFFMCDNVREKDTAIGYHVCVGINGISELETSKDFTVLEAFCFEAIFTNFKGKPKFIDNFNSYIKKASQESKEHFTTFQTHLMTVKDKCYAAMEKDKDLEKVIIKHYKLNIDNINFKIE